MSLHNERTYRHFSSSKGLVSFRVTQKESDLFIAAKCDLSAEAERSLAQCRRKIELYGSSNTEFMTSLVPVDDDPLAPEIVRDMLVASRQMDVGPMAGVAGVIAEYVGRELLSCSPEIIIENGGDTYLVLKEREGRVGLFSGDSPLSSKINLIIPASSTPVAVCTSSATVGPSLSFGKADAVCVLATSGALADAAATSFCNKVHHKNDVRTTIARAREIEGIRGIVIVVGDTLGAWGEVELA